MSYSFSARGATKEELLAAIDSQLGQVVEAQPVHETDRAAARASAESFVDLVELPEGHGYSASIHGSISTVDDAARSVSIGVSIGTVSLETA